MSVLADQEPERILAAAIAATGGLDVFVSNDAYPAVHGPIEDANLDDLRTTLERLVVFPFALARAAIPHLKTRAVFVDDPKRRAFVEQVVPVGRLAEPAEIGELVRYLATAQGTFMTGAIIDFSGAWPAAPARPGRLAAAAPTPSSDRRAHARHQGAIPATARACSHRSARDPRAHCEGEPQWTLGAGFSSVLQSARR